MTAEKSGLSVPAVDELTLRRDAPGGVGLLVACVVLVLSGAPVGLAAAIVFALSGLVVPPLLAFAGGQLLLIAVVGTPMPFELAAGQIGLFAVLTEPLRAGDAPRGPTLVSAGAFCVLGAGVASLVRQVELLWTSILLAGATGALVYGSHRYVLVKLGLTRSSMETNDDHDNDE